MGNGMWHVACGSGSRERNATQRASLCLKLESKVSRSRRAPSSHVATPTRKDGRGVFPVNAEKRCRPLLARTGRAGPRRAAECNTVKFLRANGTAPTASFHVPPRTKTAGAGKQAVGVSQLPVKWKCRTCCGAGENGETRAAAARTPGSSAPTKWGRGVVRGTPFEGGSRGRVKGGTASPGHRDAQKNICCARGMPRLLPPPLTVPMTVWHFDSDTRFYRTTDEGWLQKWGVLRPLPSFPTGRQNGFSGWGRRLWIGKGTEGIGPDREK